MSTAVSETVCNGVPVVAYPAPLPDCDVYLFDYRSPLGDDVLQTLSAEEQARSERFVAPLDAWRFRARRAFVRSVLSHRLGRTAQTIEFVVGDFGKPRLACPWPAGPDIEFSVSGSAGFAVLAIAASAVGIDIEDSDVGVWHPPSASLVLSRAELDWVASARDADSAFLRCWTRKEALAKLEGTGLHESLTGHTLTPQCSLPDVEIVDLPHPASGALALALRTVG